MSFGDFMKKKKSHLVASIRMTKEEIDERQKSHRDIIERAKLLSTDNGKTISELEETIVSRFGGTKVTPEDYIVRTIKMNIAMNKYIEKNGLTTVEEIESYRNEVLRIIEEEMTFDIVVYELSDTNQYGNKAMIKIDRIHKYLTFSNGKRELWNELIIAFGVYQNDIDDETDRFISYAYALEDENNKG